MRGRVGTIPGSTAGAIPFDALQLAVERTLGDAQFARELLAITGEIGRYPCQVTLLQFRQRDHVITRQAAIHSRLECELQRQILGH